MQNISTFIANEHNNELCLLHIVYLNILSCPCFESLSSPNIEFFHVYAHLRFTITSIFQENGKVVIVGEPKIRKTLLT